MGLKKCFLIVMLLSLIGCDNSKSTKDKNSTILVKVADEKKPLFTMLSPEETGIAFINKNIENDRYNFYKYEYFYNGGGVAVADFNNDGTNFINETESYGLANQVGWWNSLLTIDINKDGYKDIVAGNLGTNTKHKASEKEPFKIYAKDFDNSGTNDVVLGYYNDGKLYPVRGKQCSAQQLPEIDEKVTSYNEFGLLKLEEIYGKQNLENATSYDATNFKSTTFINLKGESFDIEFLPNQAQLASTNGILSLNINKDDIPDLLLVGNHYQ